ncbi:MAG: DNA primase [Oscillospiraceae bacterium]|nr:DNA primase [Oscillospiraceae bacterium]
MEYDIFKEIKSRLSMPDLVKGYGIEINRKDYCNCPFHAEKTPSMHIMEKGYYCFGCGEGGDHIKFVQKLFNLENPLDAAKKINEDFGLGLDPNHKPTKEEFISARNIVTERQEFEREENIAFNAFCDYSKILRDYGRNYAPQSESEVPDKRFIEYLHNFERIEHTVNRMIELMLSPMNERKEFLRDNEYYLVFVAERLIEIRHESQKVNENSYLNTLDFHCE